MVTTGRGDQYLAGFGSPSLPAADTGSALQVSAYFLTNLQYRMCKVDERLMTHVLGVRGGCKGVASGEKIQMGWWYFAQQLFLRELALDQKAREGRCGIREMQ